MYKNVDYFLLFELGVDIFNPVFLSHLVTKQICFCPHFLLLDVGSFDIRCGQEKLSGGGRGTLCRVHRYIYKYSAEEKYGFSCRHPAECGVL